MSWGAALGMTRVRPQYHFRESDAGLLAWDVRRLIELSQTLPVVDVPLSSIAELDANRWFTHSEPTCRSVAEHAQLIESADIRYPIILDSAGRVMDGMHRVCKALALGMSTIPSVRFERDPDPDTIGKGPDELPYED